MFCCFLKQWHNYTDDVCRQCLISCHMRNLSSCRRAKSGYMFNGVFVDLKSASKYLLDNNSFFRSFCWFSWRNNANGNYICLLYMSIFYPTQTHTHLLRNVNMLLHVYSTLINISKSKFRSLIHNTAPPKTRSK